MVNYVYVGGGFFPEDGMIHSFRLSLGDSPALTPLRAVRQGGSFPLWIAADAAKAFVYTTDSPNGADDGFVHAYALGEGGVLTHLNKQCAGGAVSCHLSVVGKTVLIANYSGSNVACLPIQADGSLGSATVHAHPAGTGDLPPCASGRQVEPLRRSRYAPSMLSSTFIRATCRGRRRRTRTCSRRARAARTPSWRTWAPTRS